MNASAKTRRILEIFSLETSGMYPDVNYENKVSKIRTRESEIYNFHSYNLYDTYRRAIIHEFS